MMMKTSTIPLVRLAMLLALGSCSHEYKARSAKEFIEQYSKAWQRQDVDGILSLQADAGVLERLNVDPALKADLAALQAEKEREEIADDVERRGFGYQAWTHTAYARERDHGDHVHVDVTVSASPSTIVLVRDGERLLLHPRPSWYAD